MEYTLNIDQGCTFLDTVEIKVSEGVPEDLTGSTFLLQIRDYSFSTDVRISATDVNGLLDVSRVAGVISIKLPPSETSKLVINRGVYDLIQTKANGDKFKVISGDVQVKFGVSR